MEKKKSLCILLLSVTLLLVGIQIVNVTGSVTNEIEISKNSLIETNPIQLAVTDPFINETSLLEDPVWFWVNLSVVCIVTPVLFIVPSILIKDKKDDEVDEVDEDPKTAVATENAIVARMGWLTLFIQNILVLVFFVLFWVLTLSVSADTIQAILQTYFIVFDVDFIAAALLIVGLIILGLKLPKQKASAYLAAAFWLIFIGVAIYPRITLVTQLTGGLGSSFNLAGLESFVLNYTGSFIFLQTLGHCFFALAIFYTVKFLFANSKIKGKGIANAFGITNYVVGSLWTLIISIVLTFGNQIEMSAGGSLMILWGILFGAKLVAVPILGLIASILAFNHMKPAQA